MLQCFGELGGPLGRAIRHANNLAKREKHEAELQAALLAQTTMPLDLEAAVEANITGEPCGRESPPVGRLPKN